MHAGIPDAKQCSVTLPVGTARTLRCRSRSVLTLVTRDKDGNTCTRGGARVEVAARAVGSVQPGQVVDNGNGTYGLVLELDVEGDWEITASVDGTPVSGMPIKVHAAYEPITAAECELGEFDVKSALTAGQSTKLTVQVQIGSCCRPCFVMASYLLARCFEGGSRCRLQHMSHGQSQCRVASECGRTVNSVNCYGFHCPPCHLSGSMGLHGACCVVKVSTV